MGLIGGMARTAVVAGTATAVSNRVSRRQAARWEQQSYQQQAQYAPPPQQQYAPPPQQYAPPPQQYEAAPAAAAPAEDDLTEQIQKLAGLHAQGILSDEEFAAAKARLLG